MASIGLRGGKAISVVGRPALNRLGAETLEGGLFAGGGEILRLG